MVLKLSKFHLGGEKKSTFGILWGEEIGIFAFKSQSKGHESVEWIIHVNIDVVSNID